MLLQTGCALVTSEVTSEAQELQVGWEEKRRHRATRNTSSARELSSSYIEVIMGCASLRSRYEYIVHSPKELRERWLKSMASYNHLENQGPSE